MDEIAAVSIRAKSLLKESNTDLSLIFAIHLIVFLKLLQSMSKLTSFFIGTIAIFDEFFAELGFLLVGM
jgi:hypothetical protein